MGTAGGRCALRPDPCALTWETAAPAVRGCEPTQGKHTLRRASRGRLAPIVRALPPYVLSITSTPSGALNSKRFGSMGLSNS